jgi:ATP-binding cassette subfamily B protein
MEKNENQKKEGGARKEAKPKGPGLLSILGPYKGILVLLAVFTVIGNAISLAVPRLISRGIDAYGAGTYEPVPTTVLFLLVAFGMLLFTYAQGFTQTYASERVARDLRAKLADRIASLSYSRMTLETPSKLLTNLTSDIDAIKMFVSFGAVTAISSVVLIVGSAALLLSTDWKLALAVLAILPFIGVLFAAVFAKIGPLFEKSQGIVDKLNAAVANTVAGAALVRVLDAGTREAATFTDANSQAKDLGMRILKYFAFLIPSVGVIANLAIIVILAMGGKFVISGSMTLGEFTAFNAYVFILIFPIIMLGFVTNIFSRAQASYGRVREVLNLAPAADDAPESGTLTGAIEVKGLSLSRGEKHSLKGVSLTVAPGSKVAVVGPTAAGKTELLHSLVGLTTPDSGEVLYDGKPLASWKRQALHSQVALVFQDSALFNLTLRENVAFSPDADDASLRLALETAELSDFAGTLPKGLDTLVSERGTSLSGGQKQRLMLARALAVNPKVLLLDDFTARVDAATEAKILANLDRNYPGLTVVSVTQKVRSAARFDKVVLIMEGEVLAEGTHAELMATSPEYVQIAESQKSTQSYE